MKIQNESFSNRDGSVQFNLREVAIALLESATESQGIDAARMQVELAAKISESSEDSFDVTPEEAAMIRSLIAISNVPPVIKVPMYDALDPPRAASLPDDQAEGDTEAA